MTTAYVSPEFLNKRLGDMGLLDSDMVRRMQEVRPNIDAPQHANREGFFADAYAMQEARSEQMQQHMDEHAYDREQRYRGHLPSRSVWRQVLNQSPNDPWTLGFVHPDNVPKGTRGYVHPQNVPPGVRSMPANFEQSEGLWMDVTTQTPQPIDVFALTANLKK